MTINYTDISVRNSEPVSSEHAMTSSRITGLYRKRFKRVFDLGACLLTAPFMVPLIALLALCVAMDGGRPFYSQLRIGRGGRTYRIWKMRSMVKNADNILEAHLATNPAARAEWDLNQKLKCDPRITRLGHFLRRSSLDELPQLWNVFLGQMSLVGPRPMMVSQKDLYSGRDYYVLRPGITGSWQVSDRNKTSFAQRAVFDRSYNQNLSLIEDLRILRDTVFVVLRATGC